jgi:hypothetical protein
MAKAKSGLGITVIQHVKKRTSQGKGGRGNRKVPIATSSMNKSRKRSYKKYRGQGR